MERLQKILTNPIVLSIVFSSVIIYLLPPVFKKFELNLILKTKYLNNTDLFYDDLDGDGRSEQLEIYANEKGYACLYIRNNKGKTINQWNLNHSYNPMNYGNFNDVNGDGFKEVFIFTLNNDSIFLNTVDPLKTESILFENKFITTVNKINGKPDFLINKGVFADLNNDGYKEIIFTINAGYSKFPRKLFSYNIKNNNLNASRECGNVIIVNKTLDLNNDGSTEIITNTWAPRNFEKYPKPIEFHDTSIYLMVFDSNLDFYFPPIVYDYSIGDLINKTINIKGENYILSIQRIWSESKQKSSLSLLNTQGQLVKKVLFPETDGLNPALYENIHLTKNNIIIFTNYGDVLYYNHDLKLVKISKSPFKETLSNSIQFIDINADNNDEIIYFDSENVMTITDNKFKNPIIYKFETEKQPRIVLKKNGENPPIIIATTGKKVWFFNYKFNNLYYWHYPIYLFIFLFILLINYLIQRYITIQIQRNYETRRQITELQLKTIRNQMEPHFTFNALNSIASAIIEGDKETAYNYFMKISKLIRTTLMHSENITRSIGEEIDFVTTYLEIQQFRFKSKVNFNINVDESVSQNWKIPKMLIQIYAENSVKHGLKHLKKDGLININLKSENNVLIIEVEDNGIGRKRAMEIGSKSTGKGQQIINQYYKLFNSNSKVKIETHIIDLENKNGEARGTKVICRVPINM